MISILAFPASGIPYVDCLYPALQSCGVEVREGIFAGRWLLANLRDVDYVHIHWPNFFYSRPRILSTFHGFGLFLFLLVLARWRGVRIIWTVHNLQPHDPCIIPGLDAAASWLLIRLATRFFVHGMSAEREVLDRFPRMAGRIVVIDHGHWQDLYPDTIGRDAARRKLSINERDYTFLLIGLCKRYKNLEGLIYAFERLPGQPALVIAGHFPDKTYETSIRALIDHSPARIRIRLFPRYIPDEEIQVFLYAADAVVVPYLEVLTSGTGLLALTFGRPLIAPARGSLKDIVTEDCGLLYNLDAADGLKETMVAIMSKHFEEAKIRKIATTHDWRKSAQVMVDSLTSA